MATTGLNQYSDTRITDFYLNLAKLPTADDLLAGKTAQFITVEPRFQHRLDLLSHSIYGTSAYWWVIALLNRTQLEDPIRDLRAGMVLRVLPKTAISGVI